MYACVLASIQPSIHPYVRTRISMRTMAVRMVPGNSIELQVRYINRLHFSFEALTFLSHGWYLALVKLILFCSTVSVCAFFSSFRFIFFSTFRAVVVLVGGGGSYPISTAFVFFSLQRMIFHPPSESLINCVCVRASSSSSAASHGGIVKCLPSHTQRHPCLAHRNCIHGGNIKGSKHINTLIHSHISTRTHLHSVSEHDID